MLLRIAPVRFAPRARDQHHHCLLQLLISPSLPGHFGRSVVKSSIMPLNPEDRTELKRSNTATPSLAPPRLPLLRPDCDFTTSSTRLLSPSLATAQSETQTHKSRSSEGPLDAQVGCLPFHFPENCFFGTASRSLPVLDVL